MRINLVIAVALFGFMASLARADEPGPVLPSPTVNIQQPPLARPMPAPRPRVSRPDPPVKTASVKKSSRPERRKSKRRPEKSKPRPVVEAKAKSPARRASPAKPEKAAPSEATSSVEAPAQRKAPVPEHPLRKPTPVTTAQDKPAAPRQAPESHPVIDLRKPATDQPEQQDAVPGQLNAAKTAEPKPDIAAQTAQKPAPDPSQHQETTPGQQTAAVSPQPTTEPQEERTLWWARQGSPAVARFRDCSAAFAARNVGKDTKATWADLLIRAAEGDCRVVFNEMANILTDRLGNDAKQVMQSLIETTFLPAARKAVASTQRVAGGKSDPAPATPPPAQ